MAFFKVALLFVVVFVFQASGDTTSSEEISEIPKGNEYPTRIVQQDIATALSNLRQGSQSSVEMFLRGAKATLTKLKSCKLNKKFQLIRQANLSFINFQACINATRDVADLETFLLHLYNLTRDIETDVVSLAQNMFECRSAGTIYDILTCLVNALQNSGTDFDAVLSKAKEIIAELQGDAGTFFTDVNKCLGFSLLQFVSGASKIIKTC